MSSNTTTIVGNVTAEPELKFSNNGSAYVNFSIAVNHMKKDGTEPEVSYFDVTAFGSLAENVSNSVTRGTRVMVSGSLKQSSWEDKETGKKNYRISLLADEVAPSLRWASATVQKNERNDNNNNVGATSHKQFSPRRETVPASQDYEELPF
jgi:single-strand DNA-binding protein